MSEAWDRELLRDLRGELDAESSAALRRRLAEDPALRERARALAESWQSLTSPPEAAAPPGFAQRVMARAREGKPSDLSWSLLPRWAKVVAVLALVTGIATGAGVAVSAPPRAAATSIADAEVARVEGMAEQYLDALESEAAAESAGVRP